MSEDTELVTQTTAKPTANKIRALDQATGLPEASKQLAGDLAKLSGGTEEGLKKLAKELNVIMQEKASKNNGKK